MIPVRVAAVKNIKNAAPGNLDLEMTTSVTRVNIDKLASSLKVSIPELLRGEVVRTAGNEQELLELEGEVAILQHLEEELSSLEELQVCP